jgi:hypothetical protein
MGLLQGQLYHFYVKVEPNFRLESKNGHNRFGITEEVRNTTYQVIKLIRSAKDIIGKQKRLVRVLHSTIVPQVNFEYPW